MALYTILENWISFYYICTNLINDQIAKILKSISKVAQKSEYVQLIISSYDVIWFGIRIFFADIPSWKDTNDFVNF